MPPGAVPTAICSSPSGRWKRGHGIVARSAIAAVEHAMQVAGCSAFYRGNGLGRLFRDVQGARFHPLQEGPQRELAGKIALGLELD
jgi:indole-3-acetate monooxygenase